MKVLTLKQPWATLIALGEKKIETRSWKTNYRGPLLIHAGKSIEKDICLQEPFLSVLNKNSIYVGKSATTFKPLVDLPTGVIIAKCNLVACHKIIEEPGNCAITDGHILINGNEYEFGNYEVGRYAWILNNIELLKEPIPAKGKLSLWEYDLSRG